MSETKDLKTFCENQQLWKAFRDNIRSFLQEFAELQSFEKQGMKVWRTLLHIEGKDFRMPLYIIEQEVKEEEALKCDHSIVAGWNHPLCRRSFHIIIPSESEEGWKPIGQDIFTREDHTLWGLLHSNGYGHLLSIRGRMAGNIHLGGGDVMSLWDRICKYVGARAISLKDNSKRGVMDLRLLHGVAFGHCWFGKWGYKYCRGTFGVNELTYTTSLSVFGSLKLSVIIELFDGSSVNRPTRVRDILLHYKALSCITSDKFQDLLAYLLNKTHYADLSKRDLKSVDDIVPKEKCSIQQIQLAVQEIMAVLIGMHGPITRIDLRSQVIGRGRIMAASVLDHVLPQLHKMVVDNRVILRTKSPRTKRYEYTLITPVDLVELVKENIYSDVRYLYQQVMLLFPDTEEPKNWVKISSEKVLNCKYFFKAFVNAPSVKLEEVGLRAFECQMLLFTNDTDYSLEVEREVKLVPSETVVIPIDATTTIGDLRKAAESAFRDTYFGVELLEIIGWEDDELVSRIRTKQLQLRGRWNIAGCDRKKVKCKCMADAEDGERMVECNICSHWHHTLCSEINDDDPLPLVFCCSDCLKDETRGE